jgi:hypothetical protein
MSGQPVWVPSDVYKKADNLLKRVGESSGQAIKEGVELILKNNLSIGGVDPGPGSGRVEASVLLAKG